MGGLTVGDVARHFGSLSRTRDRPAVLTHTGGLSWSEIDQRATRLANSLAADGVSPGSRVAVLLWNDPAYFEIMYGVARAGAVIVPVNARLVPREVAYCLQHSGAEVLITAGAFRGTVEQAVAAMPGPPPRLLVLGDDGFGRSYEEALATAYPEYPDIAVGADDPYWIAFTSGTTGPPKAALVTHRQLVDTWTALVLELELTSQDSELLAAPIFGGIGFNFGLACLYAGGRVVLQEQFAPAAALETIEQHRISIVPVVPTMLTMMMDSPGAEHRDVTSVRIALSMGAALPSAIRRRVGRFFPSSGVYNFYGATELGVVTALHPEDQDRKEGSVGQPFIGVQVRLLDDNGDDVSPGEIGEIYKRGMVLSGSYYRNPDATAAVHRGEWVTSNDLGRFDDDGYLYIVDRKKDMIVTGGMNVYPSEVEEVLCAHPHVAMAAVIGVPDRLWGEAVSAFVVPRPGQRPTEEEILRLCREQLADFKRPKTVTVVDELPLSPAGKVLRRVLREGRQYAGIHP